MQDLEIKEKMVVLFPPPLCSQNMKSLQFFLTAILRGRFSEEGNFSEEAQAGLTGMGGGFDPRWESGKFWQNLL